MPPPERPWAPPDPDHAERLRAEEDATLREELWPHAEPIFLGGQTVYAVAARIGVDHETIRRWAHQAGTPPRSRHVHSADPRGTRFSLAEVAEAVALCEAGHPRAEVAARMATTVQTVGRWVRAHRAGNDQVTTRLEVGGAGLPGT